MASRTRQRIIMACERLWCRCSCHQPASSWTCRCVTKGVQLHSSACTRLRCAHAVPLTVHLDAQACSALACPCTLLTFAKLLLAFITVFTRGLEFRSHLVAHLAVHIRRWKALEFLVELVMSCL